MSDTLPEDAQSGSAGRPTSRQHRLSHRADLDRVFKQGRRSADRFATVLACPNELAWPRCAAIVTRRHGGAVQRNRLKRLCREAFRTLRATVPAQYDYVIIPRAGAEVTLARLVESFGRLAAKAAGAVSAGPSRSDAAAGDVAP